MKVNVGSKNPVKVSAVREIIQDYDFLSEAQVGFSDTDSEVSEQPMSLEETIHGARNRAKHSFQDCNYSFGIEAGLIKAEGTNTGYFNVTICVIYDGENYFLGMSSGFEYPKKVIQLVLNENLQVDHSAKKVGITKEERAGYTERGLIGILTKERLSRKEYIKEAIRMALIELENKEIYQ